MARVTKIGPWDHQTTTKTDPPLSERFRSHAASLRRVARVIANSEHRVQLERYAQEYEKLADEIASVQ